MNVFADVVRHALPASQQLEEQWLKRPDPLTTKEVSYVDETILFACALCHKFRTSLFASK